MIATGRLGQVDADLRRQRGWLWSAPLEPLLMCGKGFVQHLLSSRVALRGLAEVHHRWGHVSDPGVAVLLVVPGEESLAEAPRIELRIVRRNAQLANPAR